MSDQDDLRSPHDIDTDAERFVDDDVEDLEAGLTRAIDVPPEGSVPDIIDQHTEVPDLDEI
jgi:hypothetical protein